MRQVMADERAAEQAAADALAAGLAPPENVVNAAPISKEDLKKLQNLLYELRLEDCAICFDKMEEPRITRCKHVFCLNCIATALEQPGASCPVRPGASLDIADRSDVPRRGQGRRPGRPAGGRRAPAGRGGRRGAAVRDRCAGRDGAELTSRRPRGRPHLVQVRLSLAFCADPARRLRELIKILKACGKHGDGTRSLVFSQVRCRHRAERADL